MNNQVLDSDELDHFLGIAINKMQEEINSGNPRNATEWSSLILHLSKLKSSQTEQQDTEKENLADPKQTWQEWWESIDEIIFLFIGITIGLVSEVITNLFHPLIPLVLSFLLLSIMLVIVLNKRKKLTSKF